MLQEQYLFIHEVLQVLIKRKMMRQAGRLVPSTPNHYVVGPFGGRRASAPYVHLPARSHPEA
jgi:hypothetical protein